MMLQRPVNMQVGSHLFRFGSNRFRSKCRHGFGGILPAFELEPIAPDAEIVKSIGPTCMFAGHDFIPIFHFTMGFCINFTTFSVNMVKLAQKLMKLGKETETTAFSKGNISGKGREGEFLACFWQRLNSNMIQRISRSKIYAFIYRVVQEVVCCFSVQNRRSMRNIGKA